ncbi:NPC1 [Lepeophtheirus salmonis]|uniref:NPC1 n=1 Tax=Lepeophtheirus salmonis TaxID=72036 RepID=A0A7R8CQ26_LEPSM|nr:NPC1 [Lepeophtheirus salmonis]CAF2891413.1 NPC1 [Lepeophtheirus salmonis]
MYFKTILFILILNTYTLFVNGDCIWYDQCGFDPNDTVKSFSLNCKYEGVATKAKEKDFIDILRLTCPHLEAEALEQGLCCSISQMKDLLSNFKIPEIMFGRCPICLMNFKKYFCDMTCHPDQSNFLKIIETVKLPSTEIELVKTIEYSVNEDFIKGIFDSCYEVNSPQTSSRVMKLVCGKWGDKLCTPLRWFSYLGDRKGGHNPTVPHCDSSNATVQSCACLDCKHACPKLDADEYKEILTLKNEYMNFPIAYSVLIIKITLQDVCYKPLAPEIPSCLLQSVWNYWQGSNSSFNLNITNDRGHQDTYLDHLTTCVENPFTIKSSTAMGQSCLSKGFVPLEAKFVMGGFKTDKSPESLDSEDILANTSALIMTFLLQNHIEKDRVEKAIKWEKSFVKWIESNLENFPLLDIAFIAEMSIQDAIESNSHGDVLVVIISYFLMFVYVSFALTDFRNKKYFGITLAIAGIFMVLGSILSTTGLFGFIGVKATMIIFEIVPFLVLAVGIDNIFVLVLTARRKLLSLEGREMEVDSLIGITLEEIAPAMLISTLTQTCAFYLGTLSKMPAVVTFALYAGNISINQLFSSDHRPCAHEETDCEIFCHVGLDPESTMPKGSYVKKYFEWLKLYYSVGPPVYFVVNSTNMDLATVKSQNRICGSAGCDPYSFQTAMKLWSTKPDLTTLATSGQSWIDDYFSWSNDCCMVDSQGKICSDKSPDYASLYSYDYTDYDSLPQDIACTPCSDNYRVNGSSFKSLLPLFLHENPNESCPKGGKIYKKIYRYQDK